jgi:cell division protease FtsH
MASLNPARNAGTAEDCHRLLRRILAGRAAEEIRYGAGGYGVGGVEDSDLAIATRIAAGMVGSFGHSGPHPLVYLADYRDTEEILSSTYLRVTVQKELDVALNAAKRMLAANRAVLREAANRLLAKGRIDGEEVRRMLEARRSGDAPRKSAN